MTARCFSLKSKLRAQVLACIAFLLAATPAIAAVTQAPGSRVSMDIPKGFEISKLFSGFVYPVAGASFFIVELPAAQFDKIVRGFTDEALAKRGITKVKRSKLERSTEHLFFTGQQTHRGTLYDKYTLLFKDDRNIALVTANIPATAVGEGFIKQSDIIKALTTARLVEKAAPIKKPFELSYLGPFKQAGKIAGSAVMYTEDGKLQPAVKGAARNLLIVAPSIHRIQVTDMRDFAQSAIKTLKGYKDVQIQKIEEVERGGLKGIHLTATATDAAKPNTTATLHQTTLSRTGGGYFRLLAILKADSAARLSPEIDKIFATFKPKP